jgi:hypothetical protein
LCSFTASCCSKNSHFWTKLKLFFLPSMENQKSILSILTWSFFYKKNSKSVQLWLFMYKFHCFLPHKQPFLDKTYIFSAKHVNTKC